MRRKLSISTEQGWPTQRPGMDRCIGNKGIVGRSTSNLHQCNRYLRRLDDKSKSRNICAFLFWADLSLPYDINSGTYSTRPKLPKAGLRFTFSSRPHLVARPVLTVQYAEHTHPWPSFGNNRRRSGNRVYIQSQQRLVELILLTLFKRHPAPSSSLHHTPYHPRRQHHCHYRFRGYFHPPQPLLAPTQHLQLFTPHNIHNRSQHPAL